MFENVFPQKQRHVEDRFQIFDKCEAGFLRTINEKLRKEKSLQIHNDEPAGSIKVIYEDGN